MHLNKSFNSFFFLIFSITVLLLLSNLPVYYNHLSTDINVFCDRVIFFLDNHNLTNLNYNEYQPGAISFFIFLLPFMSLDNLQESFKIALFIANIIIILVLGYLYKQIADENVVLFALLLLFIGPIFFFRFDLLVSLFVVLAIISWNKNQYILSVIILALATTIKIYPVIFLPYLIIIGYKNFGSKFVLKILGSFVLTITAFTTIYLIMFQVSLQQIIFSINYHLLKPVSTDNLYGLFVYFYNVNILGKYPELISAYGTNGISNNDILIPLWFYNQAWIIPFIIVHVLLVIKKTYAIKINLLFIVANLLFFLIFSKSIAPQYMIWFITLLPLINPNVYLKNSLPTIMIFTFSVLFLYQYIYPLNYEQWLAGFHPPYNFKELMPLNILRNVLLVIVALELVKISLRNRIVNERDSRIN